MTGKLPMIGKAYITTPNMDKPERIETLDVWNELKGE